MRILTRITISAAVAILSVVPSAGAASNISQVALTKCSKVGSVRVVKAINQKCTKVGKTLQWVNTKKSTTQATPTSANGSSMSALPESGSECATQGDQKVFTGGKMECRKISTGKLQWFKLSDSPAPPTQATGNVDSSQCQIADQRVNRTQPYAVGFPRSLEDTKTSGNLHLVLVAVDFADVAGTEEEFVNAQKQIDRFNEFLAFESGGKLTATWEFSKTWARMPRPSTGYPIVFGNSSGDDQFMNDMISVTDSRTNYSSNDFTFILIPKNAKEFPSLEGFYSNYQTSEGRIQKYHAAGKFFYQSDTTYKVRELWSGWLHEMGHTFGLAGHAPFGSALSIMENQDSLSKTFSAWDKFLLNWMPSNGIYCIPASTLTTVDVQLVPMQRLTSGFRSVMIPISSTKILIVESHRAEGFGDRLSKGTYGVTTYVVDTTLDNDRSGENIGQAKTRYASLVITPTASTRGFSDAQFDRPSSSGITDSLMLQGESVSYAGITISLVKTGDYDTVRISK